MSPVKPMPKRHPSIAYLVVFVLISSALAAPHGSTTSVARWKRKTTGHHEIVMPSTFSYQVVRVDQCKEDETLFGDCYLCGKITDEIRIYNGCCEKKESIIDFCERLLS